MKWLFIIAVLLNIAFGVNNLFFADKSAAKIESTLISKTIDKSQIVLLNELDSNGLRKLQDKALPKQPEITELAETDNEMHKLEQPPSKSVNNLITDLVEVQEQGSLASEGMQKAEAHENRSKSLCYRLGPFSKDLMNEVRLTLEAQYQNELSFGIETTSAITYYRIYIPPLKDKKAIKEILTQLDDNGLKDHYVMSIDGRKNAIALGVFKKRAAAEKVATKAAEIGFSTTIEAISDDKNSLYQLMVLFKNKHDQVFYQTLILEKELISISCENKG